MQVEKQRVALQHEVDDLTQRLDEAGGATQAQVTNYLYHVTSKGKGKGRDTCYSASYMSTRPDALNNIGSGS